MTAEPEVEPSRPERSDGRTSTASSLESERDLVARVLSGNREAATELYRLLYPAVDRTLRRVLGRRGPDHDDLVQLSFEQIVRTFRKRTFGHACPLRAWAITLAARVALTELRTRCRRRKYEVDEEGDLDARQISAADWEYEAAQRARLATLRRALAQLPPEHAWVLVLHDVEGHRVADIAALLGISPTAAQSRLLRGRQELLRRCQLFDESVSVEPRRSPT